MSEALPSGEAIDACLNTFLQSLPETVGCLWVAYSGGVDSLVLLHGLAQRQQTHALRLQAVHIDHGLHADAKHWRRHCADVCHALSVSLTVKQVAAAARVAELGREGAARRVRYRAFADLLQAGDYLLTAHHQDDQAETVLLQLLRGAGVAGLAAMPILGTCGRGRHVRPLLNTGRQSILDYARCHRLRWIEDPSNDDVSLQRNFIRSDIMPLLRRRRPSVSALLARSAGHCAEAAGLLDILAASDLDAIRLDEHNLSTKKLRRLDTARQRNVIRYWLRCRGIALPSTLKLSHIIGDVLYSRHERRPQVAWGDAVLERDKDRLFLNQVKKTL